MYRDPPRLQNEQEQAEQDNCSTEQDPNLQDPTNELSGKLLFLRGGEAFGNRPDRSPNLLCSCSIDVLGEGWDITSFMFSVIRL